MAISTKYVLHRWKRISAKSLDLASAHESANSAAGRKRRLLARQPLDSSISQTLTTTAKILSQVESASQYLRDIASGPFSLEVTGQSALDKLRVLSAANMVVADLPRAGELGPALVHSITGCGRACLSAHRPYGLHERGAD